MNTEHWVFHAYWWSKTVLHLESILNIWKQVTKVKSMLHVVRIKGQGQKQPPYKLSYRRLSKPSRGTCKKPRGGTKVLEQSINVSTYIKKQFIFCFKRKTLIFFFNLDILISIWQHRRKWYTGGRWRRGWRGRAWAIWIRFTVEEKLKTIIIQIKSCFK